MDDKLPLIYTKSSPKQIVIKKKFEKMPEKENLQEKLNESIGLNSDLNSDITQTTVHLSQRWKSLKPNTIKHTPFAKSLYPINNLSFTDCAGNDRVNQFKRGAGGNRRAPQVPAKMLGDYKMLIIKKAF